jgi:hypothetical protein
MGTADSTQYDSHDHPGFASRFIMVISVMVLLFALATAFPGTAHQMRGVSDLCESPACVSTRQLISAKDAWRMKRERGDHALLVDIRAMAEAPAGLGLGSDAQVPFMEPVTDPALRGPGKDSQMEFRIDFGPNVDQVLRAAHMRHEEPVILMSPSLERSVLAALLLQERGYTQVLVMHD